MILPLYTTNKSLQTNIQYLYTGASQIKSHDRFDSDTTLICIYIQASRKIFTLSTYTKYKIEPIQPKICFKTALKPLMNTPQSVHQTIYS